MQLRHCAKVKESEAHDETRFLSRGHGATKAVEKVTPQWYQCDEAIEVAPCGPEVVGIGEVPGPAAQHVMVA